MKKIIALLLVAVMCFSLAACGAKTQEVEITMDNWNEYFELVQAGEWEENDFGEGKYVAIYDCFAVKEEYSDRILLDKSDLTVEVTGTYSYVTAEYDLKNKTYSIGERLEDGVAAEYIEGDLTQSETFTLENAKVRIEGENTDRFIATIWCGAIPEVTSEIDGTIYHAIDLWEVSRIQGTIVVKEAN